MSITHRVFASARIIALLTTASRVLGFVRELILGYFFGTSELLSAFRIAFMIPNLARRLFGEGALSAAMVPVLTESLQKDGEERSRLFVGRLLIALAVVLTAGVVVIEAGIGIARQAVTDPVLWLVSIMMPYTLMVCLAAVVGGVLNVRGSFAIPAATPVLLNVVVIASVCVGAWVLKLNGAALIETISWGVVVGGVLQLALSWWGFRLIGFVPMWRTSNRQPLGESSSSRANEQIDAEKKANNEFHRAVHPGLMADLYEVRRDPLVRKVCALLVPMTLGLSAMQINTLADQLIAYLFIRADGEQVGPAVLGFAQVLYQLPLGVFGISLATAIFPALSERAAANDKAGMADILVRGVRMTQVTALPAAVGMMFIAGPLVALLFQRGQFTESDTDRVAGTVVYYCIGLAFYFTQHILIRAFYALHDSKTPARIAGYLVAVDFVMNLLLVFPLQERGLALSTSICSGLQVVWLGAVLSRRIPQMRWLPVFAGVTKIAISTGVMALALWLCGTIIGSNPTLHRPVVSVPILLAVGASTFLLTAWVLRASELKWMIESRKRNN